MWILFPDFVHHHFLLSNTEEMSVDYHRTVDPWTTDSNSQSNSFDNNFKSATDLFDSTFKWMVAGSIILSIIGTVAVVALIYAIIDCLKKAGNAIPTYTRVSNNDGTGKQSSFDETIDTVKVICPPLFPVIPDSQVKTVTMERFLDEMAREKPIRFSPQQLSGFTQNYTTLLGSGAFGVVYKGEFPNRRQVAVKVLDNSSNKRAEEQFMAEVSTIGRTYHINLVRLYGFCFDPSMTALVYEYMENGSLDKLLFGNNQTVEWEKLYQIAIGTAKGLAYLHEECQQRIIHYDIKPENVLLDGVFAPKVADFGLAKLCNRETEHVAMTGCRGTPGYAAPELWQPYPVTHKCDVYSFGMVLFEIIGRRRNHDANLSESREWLPRWTWENFKKGELGEMMELSGIDEEAREKAKRMSMVALWCVQYLPEARPLMSTVTKMLEGEKEISPPPNPFEHLELPSDFKSAALTGTSITSSSSLSTAQTSEISYSTPIKKIFEIESSL